MLNASATPFVIGVGLPIAVVAQPREKGNAEALATHLRGMGHVQIVQQNGPHAVLKHSLGIHQHKKHAARVQPEKATAVLLAD